MTALEVDEVGKATDEHALYEIVQIVNSLDTNTYYYFTLADKNSWSIDDGKWSEVAEGVATAAQKLLGTNRKSGGACTDRWERKSGQFTLTEVDGYTYVPAEA